MIPDSSVSHARNLVAQIVRDDPEVADALIKFCAIADPSTPIGAAIQADALLFAFEFTPECKNALEKFKKAAA